MLQRHAGEGETIAEATSAARRQKKKAVVKADTFSCAYEAAALIFRAAVSFVYPKPTTT
ncbi:MAG: hypothetical protein ACLRX4_04960 [Oscillospiraceae bacterium]